MKTNVTMVSEKDRNLFGVTIRQETKTMMLNLSDLQDAYTVARIQNGWKPKDVFHILGYDENIERIYYLPCEQEVISRKTTLTEFYEKVKAQGMTKTLEEFGAYRTTGRGENKTTYCNPYVWVLVAMELNPQLYAKVVMWLTDRLICNRIEAGNLYKPLGAALMNNVDFPDYPRIAVELNKKAFGRHEIGIRNMAGAEELKALARMEDNLAFAVNNGFLKDNDAIVEAIRNYRAA